MNSVSQKDVSKISIEIGSKQSVTLSNSKNSETLKKNIINAKNNNKKTRE